MKKRRPLVVTAVMIVLSFAWSGAAKPQELNLLLPGEVLPILENVELRATVSLDASGVFTYAYTITNPASNTGEIWLVDIDIIKPSGSQDLGSDGITNGPRYHQNTSELVLSTIGTPLIPVGLFSPPDWSSGLSLNGTAGWGSSDDPAMIQPGESLSGFEMISRGLPGIRLTILEPFFRQTPVEEASGEDVERIKAIEKAIAVTSKTIGPTAPPQTFVSIEFLNYLITLLHDSRQLGWIKVDGVHQSLLAKLINAKRKLETGEVAEAKNILSAFLNEVQATSCEEFSCRGNKPQTSEAYALLFFNGQYLLERLP